MKEQDSLTTGKPVISFSVCCNLFFWTLCSFCGTAVVELYMRSFAFTLLHIFPPLRFITHEGCIGEGVPCSPVPSSFCFACYLAKF